MEQYENNQAEVQVQQDIRKSRTKRRKQNHKRNENKEKKKLSLWIKCIGCVLIPYLFILLMGVVNTYAVPVNVSFVLAGSVVLFIGMIILTLLTSKRKKV